MRRITSLTALISFILLIFTSVVLYIVPPGRVAYWADWRLWGLDKTQWTEIHLNLGFLLLLCMILHIYYNWKAILLYLKDKRKKLKIVTPEFNIAMALCLVFVTGTYFHLPPLVWILDFSTAIKDAGTAKYGEPPYGHAELSSLRGFAQKMNLDLDASVEKLQKAGMAFKSPDQAIVEIAALNLTSPQHIYDIIKPARNPTTPGLLPEMPKPGLGNRTISQICAEYALDQEQVIAALARQNIEALPDKSLKEIATVHGMSPIDIYEKLKSIQNNP